MRLREQCSLMRLRETNGDQLGPMRFRETNGDSWFSEKLMETYGDSWDSDRPQWTHWRHADYWSLMRQIGSHETQRDQSGLMILRDTGNSWDKLRIMRLRETTGDTRLRETTVYSWDSETLMESNGYSWDSDRPQGTHWRHADYWSLMRQIGSHETQRDQSGLMILRDTGNSWDKLRIMRLRETTGDTRLRETTVYSWDSETLMESNGYSWDSERPMETHEAQRDYWRIMRTMGTHENQRLMQANVESWDSERPMETHETNGDSWDSEKLMETNGDSLDSERLMEIHETNGDSLDT